MIYRYSNLIPDHRAEQAGRYMLTHPEPQQRPGVNEPDVTVVDFCAHLRVGAQTWSEYRDAGVRWLKANGHRSTTSIESWERHGKQNVLTHLRTKRPILDHEAA